ncbi:ribosome recycling factor family protein [Oceanospirillum sediminis]|uniref:Ribosome recycling factor n=1 Tax=Oceanospirillum sediminis TaxID=2760088 RepID=A0A839IZ55_9GAMM|nr:ribosome recycling factor family protein [Oceanospirillum sediminis]MBB1489647.1 hypothetical protein [Oceanospirillum sediminis]
MLVTITLNSFVRRTLNTDTLKQAIKSTGATLSRKGRSRNWQLEADREQIGDIIRLIFESGEDSWCWVSKKLSENKPKLEHEQLKEVARQHPSITVNRLIALTDCSISDARIVLDEIEWEYVTRLLNIRRDR